MQLRGSTQIPRVSIVFPYYDNPEMLRFQLGRFGDYSQEALDACEIVIVDDCSPVFPARDVIREYDLPNIRLFRLGVDLPWNQDAARNIGAHEARGEYLLLTDIDHVVPESTLLSSATLRTSSACIRSREKRTFPTKLSLPMSTATSCQRSLYWDIGGYDEDFWGAYGSDRLFRTRVLKFAPIQRATKLPT
jgi:glycosyltransferase involved in cell wall biosynthesis